MSGPAPPAILFAETELALLLWIRDSLPNVLMLFHPFGKLREEMTISAPRGHLVVLGVTPIGTMPSAFVVQIMFRTGGRRRLGSRTEGAHSSIPGRQRTRQA